MRTLLIVLAMVAFFFSFSGVALAEEPAPQDLPIIGVGYAVLEAPINWGSNVKASCQRGVASCLASPVTATIRMLLNVFTRSVATSTVGWAPGNYHRDFAADGEFATRIMPWGGNGAEGQVAAASRP